MQFSIVTPCGSEDTERIYHLAWSLTRQTFQDFEWIISYSHPNQLQFNSHRIHVVKNDGTTAGSAENACLDYVKGNYTIFVDADDFLKSDALKNMNQLIKKTDSENSLYELGNYKTYEPFGSFLESQQLKYRIEGFLPEWGGSNNNDPIKYIKHTYGSDKLPSNSFELVNALDKYFIHFNNDFSLSDKKDYLYLEKSPTPSQYSDLMKLKGSVVATSFIKKYHLRFRQNDPFYYFMPFMESVLKHAQHIYRLCGYSYIDVRHNDPLHDPSLSQILTDNYWVDFIKSALQVLSDDHYQIHPAFEKYTLSLISDYLYKDIVTHSIYASTNVTAILDTLAKYLRLLASINSKAMNYVNRPSRKIFKAIIKQHYTKAHHLMKTVCKLREWHQIAGRYGTGITKYMYFHHYIKRPLNDKVILFSSFLGRNYSDNPKYIYQYIQGHHPQQFLNVWVADADHFKQIKQALHGQTNTIVVKRWSFKYMYYLATAKYIVNNMRQPKWFIKRKGSYYIETWHGTPLKKLAFDMKDISSASHLYKAILYHQSRQWDNLITDNPFSYNVFQHAFMYPRTKMLKSGYPRNDILNSSHKGNKIKQIKTKLGIPLDKKVILYAPTWRDNQFFSAGHYKFTLTLNIPLLKKYLSKDYVLILRTHYFITNHIDTSKYGNFVYNESNYNDISELYLISDILVTDYSSVFFDYATLKRPILYYVYDYNSYAKVLHGFYLSMQKDLPGPLIKTSKGILHAIQNIDQIKKRYAQRYNRFNKEFNVWDHGNASAKVVKALLKHK